MPDLQREIKEVMASIRLQEDEIKMNRKELLEVIKKTQDMKCIYSLSSGYFLHIKKENALQIANLPFVQPGKFVVYERLIELTSLGSLRTEITKLLAAIYKNSDKLPEIFAKLPSSALKTAVPFIPDVAEANHFIAFSTLPALFGHYWSSDLRYAYINFLIKISEKLPSTVFDNINEHWILDCFTHFIHSSNIQPFLRASIGDDLLYLIRDTTLDSIPRSAQHEFFNKLIPTIETIISKMNLNIDLIPMEIRILIRKFADLAPDDAQWLQRVETLFCKFILAPAISLPKVYCVLFSTINFRVTTGVARALQVLASLFNTILHPNQARLRYSELDVDRLSRIPFESFLRSVASVDVSKLSGLECTSLMPLLGLHSTSFVFNVPDICMLAYVCQSVSKIDPNLVKPILPATEKFPTDKHIDMLFFRYDIWDLGSIGIAKPDINANELEKPKCGEIEDVAKSVFNFLEQSKEIPFAPGNLFPFVKFHEEQAMISGANTELCYTCHVMNKLKVFPPEKGSEIIAALEEEIRRHKEYSSRNSSLLTHIAITLSAVNAMKKQYINKLEDMTPVLHEKLFELYHDSQDFDERFRSKCLSVLLSHDTFMEYFNDELLKLKSFLELSVSFCFIGVSKMMHTFILQKLNLARFKEYHNTLTETDATFEDILDAQISKICLEGQTSQQVKDFAKNPENFSFANKIFYEARIAEIPIEAIKLITKAFGIIKKTFILANEKDPSASETEPLLHFMILKARVDDAFSFAKFLEHFLDGDQCKILITEEEHSTLKLFLSYITYLDSRISQI